MRALFRPVLFLLALAVPPAAFATPVPAPATAVVDGTCAGTACPTDAIRAVVDAGLVSTSGGSPALVSTSGASPAFVSTTGAAIAPVATPADRLTDTQRKVLAHMRSTIGARSAESHAAALARVTALGYTEADYARLIEYLRNDAPVIIAFHPDKKLTRTTAVYGAAHAELPDYRVPVDRASAVLVDALLADTHYRNQFETGLTSGSPSAYPGGSRDTWERGLFDGLYQEGPFTPHERPKYGSLNASNDPGATATASYGSSYFVLTDEARRRATFTAGDSSGISWGSMKQGMGMVDAFEALLANPQLNDEQLRAMIRVAKGEVPSLPSRHPYVEAQIHGPVELAKDVKEIVGHARFLGTPVEAKLRELARKTGVPIRWQDGTKLVDDPRPET